LPKRTFAEGEPERTPQAELGPDLRCRITCIARSFGFAENPARQAGSTEQPKILPGRQDLLNSRKSCPAGRIY